MRHLVEADPRLVEGHLDSVPTNKLVSILKRMGDKLEELRMVLGQVEGLLKGGPDARP